MRQFGMDNTHEYSSILIILPVVLSKGIIKWGKDNIDDRKIYMQQGHGRENDIHVTVLYGINSQFPEQSVSLLKPQEPFQIELGKVSLFTSNADYDVVKIEVMSKKLHDLNKLIKTSVKNFQSFPTYKPHVTVAYVKKDTCKNLKGNFRGIRWETNTLVFSSKNGEKTRIKLSPKNSTC